MPDVDQSSVYLTFAIRERTQMWLAEKLITGALEEPEFRHIVLPGDIGGTALPVRMRDTRTALTKYLEGLDLDKLAQTERQAAMSELEYTT